VLDLVQHHEALQRLHRQHGVGETRGGAWIFQIKPKLRAAVAGKHLTGKRGLPHLPWSEDRDHWLSPQQAGDFPHMSQTTNHRNQLP
jgi:hypothetical protein